MNDVINFLECCILPLSDGTYQLRYLGGANQDFLLLETMDSMTSKEASYG